MLFKTLSTSVYGIDAYLVEVEVDVGSADMNQFDVVGLPDNAVKESGLKASAAPHSNAREAAVAEGIDTPPHSQRCACA
jgi:hypothetical protein